MRFEGIFNTASVEAAIFAAELYGLEYTGKTKNIFNSPSLPFLYWFNDPKTRSTLTVYDIGYLKNKMIKSRKKFGIESK